MKLGKGMKILASALIGVCSFAEVSFGETPEELKAQIEALKQQMAVMQAQITNLQKKLQEMQAKTEKVTVPKKTGVVKAKPGLEWKLYGRVKIDYHYDTARIEKYNDFVGTIANRETHADYKNDSSNFNPRDTRIGAIISHKKGNWLIKGRIEADFYGTNSGNNLIPRLRLAYIDFNNSQKRLDLRVGQDWIPVAQLNPSTVDFGILTAAGNLWWRIPQVTLRKDLNNNWQILVSVMQHRRQHTWSKERMPWVLSRIQYKNGFLGKGNMIALGGGYKHGRHDSTIDDVDCWLLAGEWKFNFKLADQKFLFKGEAWTGKGLGAEFLRYDLDVNSNTKSTIEAWGGWADLTWFFAPRWSFTIGAGIDNPNDSELLKGTTIAGLNDRQFTKNTQYFANLWYKLTENVKVGAEVVHIETERDNNVDTGNRFTLSAFYNF